MIDPKVFLNAVQGVQQRAEPATDTAPTSEESLEEALSVGQIFLSREEVFSSELIDAAFVSSDGRDLRGTLALRNLEAAVSLVNWQTTDDVLRQVFAVEKDLPTLMRQVPEIRQNDVQDLAGVWAQLVADNPEPKTVQDARRQYAELQKPRQVAGFPANSYLDPTTQAALRIFLIARIARDFTTIGGDLRAEWFKLARSREGMTRADFERWFALDLHGIAGWRRGLTVGMGGNFFKDLGRSISRLFKDPKTWLRNVGESIGRGLKAVETPFQFMRDKIPFLGYALGGVLPTVIGELGAALEQGNINTFNEQRLVFVTGMHLTVAGTILAAVGSVVTLFFPPLGAAMVAIGALAVAVGRAILQFQQLIRQQRLDALAAKAALIAPKVPGSNATTGQLAGTGARSSGGGGGGLLLLLGLAFAKGAG